mgnify:CR=1 FL=1
MEKYQFDDFRSYSLSKLFNLFFVRLLNDKLKNKTKNTKIYAIHPGSCKSDAHLTRTGFRKHLANFTMKCFFRSAKAGAATIVYCACSEDKIVVENSGKYFENCIEADRYSSELSRDMEWAEKVWKRTVEVTGVDLELDLIEN